MRDRRWVLLACAASALLGCGEETGGPPAPLPDTTATFYDGTGVRVTPDGRIEITSLGRTLFATAEKASLTARQFDASYKTNFGLWTFARSGEKAIPFDRLVSAAQAGDGVTVTYASAGGAKAVVHIVLEAPGAATRIHIEVDGLDPVSSLAVPLACDSDATFYGFGEQYNATDQRGEAFDLFVSEQGIGRDPSKPIGLTNGGPHTTYFPMPYYLDARGHGALFRTAHRSLVDLCKSDPKVAWFEVESGEPLDITVLHGPKPLDVIRQLGDLVGRPKAPPPWAYDLWIGSEGGRDAVLADAALLESSAIPARALWVQDWTGARMNVTGGYGVQYRWVPDQELYPDLAGMIAGLKGRGFRFLAYANPFVMTNLDHFEPMSTNGLLIQDAKGKTYVQTSPAGTASQPDLTNNAAREYVKTYLRKMVGDYGIDGWMADFGEWLPLDAHFKMGNDAMSEHNRYPIGWQRLSREVMDELRPDGDWVVFARSGFTGVQAVTQIMWTGDQQADFDKYDGLPTVVPALLNLGIAGVPYVTHDIAGFSGGPSTKELYMRWTELGAFTPIMRTHPGNRKDENWSWHRDDETLAHFRRFARVHQALIPTFRALAAEAAESSAPILRHLMLAYPDDAKSRATSDEFLIGTDLLVAPVVTAGATSREVYLPEGTWYHVWTGKPYQGGAAVTIAAPLGQPPVFSRGQDRADLRAIQ